MKNRTKISAEDLYVLLLRELRRMQSAECPDCYLQLPFRVDRRDDEHPNWEVYLPLACPQGCRELLERLVERYGRTHDLGDELGGAAG